jgi:hypothetical protein
MPKKPVSNLTTNVEDDGIVFDAASVRAEEIRENDDYGGTRATFIAMLDTAIIPLQADVGFGDAITPAAEERTYPVLVGMAAPRLRMYPFFGRGESGVGDPGPQGRHWATHSLTHA